MAKSRRRRSVSGICSASRLYLTAHFAVKVTTQGNTTTIEGTPLATDKASVLDINNPHGACPLCRLNVELKFDASYTS